MVKAVLWLNGLAIALLILEALMGPTILGNLVLLAVAVLAALIAVLLALVCVLTRKTPMSLALLIASLAVLAVPVLRFVSDTVPVGYGP